MAKRYSAFQVSFKEKYTFRYGIYIVKGKSHGWKFQGIKKNVGQIVINLIIKLCNVDI